MIFQLAGQHRNIGSEEYAIRILGFVDSVDEVDLDTYATLGELLLGQLEAFSLCDDDDDPIKTIETVLCDYERTCDTDEQTIRDRAEKAETEAETGAETEAKTPKSPVDTGSAETEAETTADTGAETKAETKAESNDPVEMRRDGQSFAVITVVQHQGKTLFMPLGAFDTDDGAYEFMTEVASLKYPRFNLYCVEMYRWVSLKGLCDTKPSLDTPFSYADFNGNGDEMKDMLTKQLQHAKKVEMFKKKAAALGLLDATASDPPSDPSDPLDPSDLLSDRPSVPTIAV